MSDKVRYAVSITPIEVLTDDNSGEHDVIAAEVGKTLGGSGEATVAGYTATSAAQGYKEALPWYKSAPDSGTGIAISTETTASLVFIKHSGYAIAADGATLGSANTTRKVKVTVTGDITIACLGAGECLVLKALQSTATIDCSKVLVETVDSDGSDPSEGDHIAVEYLVVD